MVPILVSGTILLLLLRRSNATQIMATVRNADARLVSLSIAASLIINIFVGTAKWRKILAALGYTITFSEALMVRSGCIPLKLIFPLKSHELLKALYLKQHKSIPVIQSINSLLLDKSFNLVTLVGVFVCGLAFIKTPVPPALAAAILALLILIVFFKRARLYLSHVCGRIHPAFGKLTEQLLDGFTQLSLKEKGVIILYSMLYQGSEFFNTYILMKAVGINTVPFSLIAVFLPLIMIANNLPLTVLGLGTREALMVFFFLPYAAREMLLGASIMVSLIEYIIPVCFGLLFVHAFLSRIIGGLSTKVEPEALKG